MNEQHHRPIRSFVRREGKITKSQKVALEELLPEYQIKGSDGQHIDFKEEFGRSAPIYLEVGFGNGDALFEVAKANPDINYIGIEVHRPGVGSLLLRIHDEKLKNVRLMCDDAVEILKTQIPDNSLDGLMLYFPDPWHKKRHNKRRIVQKDFADLVSKKLKIGGKWYLATDWEDYALQMLQVLSSCTQLSNLASDGQFCERPLERPVTKFEKRGKRLGHGVWDLVFKKI